MTRRVNGRSTDCLGVPVPSPTRPSPVQVQRQRPVLYHRLKFIGDRRKISWPTTRQQQQQPFADPFGVVTRRRRPATATTTTIIPVLQLRVKSNYWKSRAFEVDLSNRN